MIITTNHTLSTYNFRFTGKTLKLELIKIMKGPYKLTGKDVHNRVFE